MHCDDVIEAIGKFQTRNVAVVAHVDHGKTTLCDRLLAHNGIISERLAGQVRFLDSRPDEQEKGITMQTSVFPLLWKGPEGSSLINIIDSPGHIDFTQQVSAAIRLSDGCLLVVDVVEGICAQTRTVLRQTLVERLEPILVLNKIDRLITELSLDPQDAFLHLSRLIESVNALFASLERTEEGCRFSPEAGNVVFASATDGWAFSLEYFANFYSARKEFAAAATVGPHWWSDAWCWDAKSQAPKKIDPGSRASMFSQLALDPLWKIYAACANQEASDKVRKICDQLSFPIRDRDLATFFTNPTFRRSLLSHWLPIAPCLFRAIAKFVPAANGQKKLQNCLGDEFSTIQETIRSNPNATVISVVRMMPVHEANFMRRSFGGQKLRNEFGDSVHLIGVARVLLGTVEPNATLCLLDQPPQDDPLCERKISQQSVSLCERFLFLGRDLVPLQETSLPAGSVFGIGGVAAKAITKRATLTNCLEIPPLEFFTTPVVRTAVEPVHVADLDLLIHGLQLLHRADPCAEVLQQPNGQYVVSAAGELHLEQVLLDLKELYARVPFTQHLVEPPFRETVVEGGPEPVAVEIADCAKFQLSAVCLKISDTAYACRSGAVSFNRGTFISELPSQLQLPQRDSTDRVIAMAPNAEAACLLCVTAECYDALVHSPLLSSLLHAFSAVCSAGPACGEPLYGVSFLVADFSCSSTLCESMRFVSQLRGAFHRSLANRGVRLMAAMYSCEMFVGEQWMGKVSAVIARRFGRFVGEQWDDRTSQFHLTCRFPVAESFGFSDEIHRRTSGIAIPQLAFGGFEELEGDAMLKFSSLEDEEKFKRLRRYIETIRERKGLPIDREIVTHPEKQQTLKR